MSSESKNAKIVWSICVTNDYDPINGHLPTPEEAAVGMMCKAPIRDSFWYVANVFSFQALSPKVSVFLPINFENANFKLWNVIFSARNPLRIVKSMSETVRKRALGRFQNVSLMVYAKSADTAIEACMQSSEVEVWKNKLGYDLCLDSFLQQEISAEIFM